MEVGRIIVGVDFRSPSLQAAQWAAKLVGPGARIELAHVQSRHAGASGNGDAHRRLLAGLSGFASTLGAPPARLHVRSGDPADELLDLIEARRADLLVLGRNLEGGDDGRTRERLLRRAGIPVLVVGERAAPAARRVIVALDDRDPAETALRNAADIAARGGGELVAAHVLPAGSSEDEIMQAHAWLAERAAFAPGGAAAQARTVILTGDPADALLGFARAEPSDLLVLGRAAAAAGNVESLGRTVRVLARLAPVPVLMVPPTAEAPRGPRPVRRSLHARAVRALHLRTRPADAGQPPRDPRPAA